MIMSLYKGGQIRDEIDEEADSQNTETQPRSIDTTPPKPVQPNPSQPTKTNAQPRTATQNSQSTGDDAKSSSSTPGVIDLVQRMKDANTEKPADTALAEVDLDPKTKERMEALIWYGAQLPKERYESTRIWALFHGYNSKKSAGTLSKEESDLVDAPRYLFWLLTKEHNRQCKDKPLCGALHYTPIVAAFKLGGRIVGPQEAKEKLDAASSPPPK
jgi:hypothetical protein